MRSHNLQVPLDSVVRCARNRDQSTTGQRVYVSIGKQLRNALVWLFNHIDSTVEVEHWLARTRHDAFYQDVFWNASVKEIMSMSM